MLFSVYQAILNLLFPFALLYWVKQAIKHRVPWQQLRERLGHIPAQPQHAIWIHAASVGELGVAKKLIPLLAANGPIILSCSTSKGTVRQSTNFFLPFDHRRIIRRTYAKLQPKALILIETELWPNLICEATCPVFLVNARLSAKSLYRYNYIKPLMHKVFKHFTGIWCSAKADALRLASLGAKITCIHPNIKYLTEKKVFTIKHTKTPTFVFSCTHPHEESLLFPLFKALLQYNSNTRIVIIPRHAHRANAIKATTRTLNDYDLIIETRYGFTHYWYAQATAVFMGGSLVPHGGQNPLEPLRYNCPCFIGPYHYNFATVIESLQQANLITIIDEPMTLYHHFIKPFTAITAEPFFNQQQQKLEQALTNLATAVSATTAGPGVQAKTVAHLSVEEN